MIRNNKRCMVTGCSSDSKTAPEKIFINLPAKEIARKAWLKLAGRDPDSISKKAKAYFCEDHFDNDIYNYMAYKMGFAKVISMVDGCMPSKFECHSKIKKRKLDSPEASTSQNGIIKVRDDLITQQDEGNDCENTTALETDLTNTSIEQKTDTKLTAEKGIQVSIRPYFRSKLVQTHIATRETATLTSGVYTAFLTQKGTSTKSSSSKVDNEFVFVAVNEELPTSTAYLTEQCNASSNNSVKSEPGESMSLDSSHILKNTIYLIENKPMLYVGIHEQNYSLIDLIHRQTQIRKEHILLCLKKIRLNNIFDELADSFGITASYAHQLFLKHIPKIAHVLRSFIVNLCPLIPSFHTLSVPEQPLSCMIDCLDIHVQKPFQTYTGPKKASVLRYLISCTADGLINYISPGSHSKVSDVQIVENCGFLERLSPGTVIITDGNFSGIENTLKDTLKEKEIRILRPPRAKPGLDFSEEQLREVTIIANLRKVKTRSLKYLHDFHMLKSQSINNNLLSVIDDVLVVACGLFNSNDIYHKK